MDKNTEKKAKKASLPALSLLSAVLLLFLYTGTIKSQAELPPVTPLIADERKVLPAIPRPLELALPSRIHIPIIRVNSSVKSVGLTKAGDMEVPSHSADTGWYKNGPIPGTVGSAVIAGHLNGPDMEPGVFARLDQLKKGDSIQIFDEKGQVTFFEVREMKVYSFSEHPQEVFFSQEGIHLNLITCMGNWNRIHNQFTKRLVVFADKVE